VKKRNKQTFFILMAVVLIFSGCATVKSTAFNKFRNAMQEAQTGADVAMNINYNWARSGYIDNFSISDDLKFSSLIIKVEEAYNWSMKKPPLFLTIKKTQFALNELNESFLGYANLLSKLAGKELVSTETFDQLATDLNTNASNAAKSLNLEVSSQGLSIFSILASEAARLYIENKRQEHLLDAIKLNQTNIESYSDSCINLVRTMRGGIKSYYVDRYNPIQEMWPSKENSNVKRKKLLIEAMLNLNDKFTSALLILEELEKAYIALPKAHGNLTKAITDVKFNSEGIQNLYSSGKRLQKLYEELNKTEKVRGKSKEDIKEMIKETVKNEVKKKIKEGLTDRVEERR